MYHIKKYKVFESYKEDIISDIIDIFLSECPNEDKFKIHVSTSRSMHVGEYTPIDKDYIMVIISLQNLNYDGEYNFNIEELKPFLIRLNGYLGKKWKEASFLEYDQYKYRGKFEILNGEIGGYINGSNIDKIQNMHIRALI